METIEILDHNMLQVKRGMKLMGNHFEFTLVAKDRSQAEAGIDAAVVEIRRIEALLSTFLPDSETNRINCMAGIEPVRVSDEMLGLVKRSLRISGLTQGAFDISYGGVDKKLWNFDREMKALPDKASARSRVRLINYRNILIDDAAKSIYLTKKGMRIGFGGIGKGYAAERARTLLMTLGFAGGIVNASGDLATWGLQPDGAKWTIGIAHPDMASLPFSYLEISNMAIATSGNYEKYIMINGKKYSHTIDPRTGLPVSGIKSVTILCDNAELADALATPVTIMGVEAGLRLIDQLAGIGCIIISDENQLFTSKNIHLSA